MPDFPRYASAEEYVEDFEVRGGADALRESLVSRGWATCRRVMTYAPGHPSTVSEVYLLAPEEHDVTGYRKADLCGDEWFIDAARGGEAKVRVVPVCDDDEPDARAGSSALKRRLLRGLTNAARGSKTRFWVKQGVPKLAARIHDPAVQVPTARKGARGKVAVYRIGLDVMFYDFTKRQVEVLEHLRTHFTQVPPDVFPSYLAAAVEAGRRTRSQRQNDSDGVSLCVPSSSFGNDPTTSAAAVAAAMNPPADLAASRVTFNAVHIAFKDDIHAYIAARDSEERKMRSEHGECRTPDLTRDLPPCLAVNSAPTFQLTGPDGAEQPHGGRRHRRRSSSFSDLASGGTVPAPVPVPCATPLSSSYDMLNMDADADVGSNGGVDCFDAELAALPCDDDLHAPRLDVPANTSGRDSRGGAVSPFRLPSSSSLDDALFDEDTSPHDAFACTASKTFLEELFMEAPDSPTDSPDYFLTQHP